MPVSKTLRQNKLYIYTDGSSYSKPRKGGMGIRYLYLNAEEEEVVIDDDIEGYKEATNNQMELLAVIEALKRVRNMSLPFEFWDIEVRTDSSYVVDNKYNALYTWSKNKWCNRFGRPIENVDLWKDLVKILKALNKKVDIVWVKGHSKDRHNKAVDKLAKVSAKSFLKEPMKVVKLRRKKSTKSTKIGSIEMKGQKISIHIINDEYFRHQKVSKYRYEVISKRSKYYQNVDIIFSELHHLKSGHSYIVTFNKDQNNPRVLSVIKEIVKEAS